MTQRIAIEATRFWPRVTAVFWFAEALFGVALGVFGLTLANESEWIFQAAIFGGSALLIVVGVTLGLASCSMVFGSGPIIVMDENGFLDRRLSDQVVPWPSMRWGVFQGSRGGPSILFRTDPPTGLRVRWYMRVIGWMSMASGFPPHLVLTLGTGKSVPELADMIALFRQPSY